MIIMLFVQGNKKKLRAKIIEYYVEVATECYDKGNFNSAMAVIGKSSIWRTFLVNIPVGLMHIDILLTLSGLKP